MQKKIYTNPIFVVIFVLICTAFWGYTFSQITLTESSGVSALNVLVELMLICIGIFVLNFQKNKADK